MLKSITTVTLLCLALVRAIAGEGPIVMHQTLTQEAAEAIVAAAKTFAAGLESPIFKPAKTKMHIHVVGYEGTLMAATQALGAWPGSDDIATRKAHTAWLFQLPTRVLGAFSRPDQEAKGPVYGIELSNGGLITFPGGLPIVTDAGFVGAIGVSGDTVDADEQVAKAGADAIKGLKNPTVAIPGLSQSAAEAIVAAAKAKAAGLDSPLRQGEKVRMHVHVLGVDGKLLAATQADSAWPGSDDIATRKAYTSWLFRFPTRVIGELSRADQPAKGPLYGIEVSNGVLISFPGGLPILDADGNRVGAIGVSGDTVDMDEAVAKAGVEAFAALQKK